MSNDDCNNLNNKGLDSPEEQKTTNSFVRKVRSRVSELIPSSLSKWFGSETTKKAVVRLREENDNELDEQLQQPPLKRIKLPTGSSPVNNYTPGKFLPPKQGPSRSLFIRDDNIPGPSRGYDFYNGDKDSESGESTSGYSSIVKTTTPNSGKKNVYDITNVINENNLFSQTNLGNHRSLFMDRSISSNANTSLSSRRPSFNASTFGSPSFVDRTLSTQQIMKSPFYNGCTMYGGIAATIKPKAPRVQVKPINETAQNVNHNATLSKTARRILDTLEQYATDVNRMPHPLSDKKSLAAKYSGANPYIIREYRPPNRELQVPTVPELLRMKLKERLQDSTVAVRHIASISKSAQDEYKTSKHSNKIKSKISSVRQKLEDEVVHKTNLPDITLPITTLPKFDLSFPLPLSNNTKPVTVVCSEPPKSKPLDVPAKPTEIITQNLPVKPKTPPVNKVSEILLTSSSLRSAQEFFEFEFAAPLVLAENIKSIIAINNFKFSEPVIFNKLKSADGFNLKLKGNSVAKILENDCVDFVKFKSGSGTWECSNCWLRNLQDNTKCAACEAPKRTEGVRPKDFGAEFKLSDEKWECTSCMVRNLNKDNACVACSISREKPNGPIVASFGGKFKPPSNSWECSTCMIRNKDELDRCVACETPKPGASMPKQQNSWDMFKMRSDQWECSVCLVCNSLDKTKCVSCETPKLNKRQAEVNTAPLFVFGMYPKNKTLDAGVIPTESIESDKPAPLFSFGIKNAQPSDGLNETTPFVFGNKPNVTQTETSSSTFTFGLKSNANVQPEIVKNAIQEESKMTAKTDPIDSDLVVFREPVVSKAPITTTPSKKYFTSSPTAFTLPDRSKTRTSTPFGFSMPTGSSAVPSIFGASSNTVTTKGLEVSKPLFGNPDKPLFQIIETNPILETQLPRKNLFETPVQPFETFVKPFETSVPSKPLFQMPVLQPKSAFESPAPVFNSGFNTMPSFSFEAKPEEFIFGAKQMESVKSTSGFNFGALPSSGFSFGVQPASSSTPVFNFNVPKTEQSQSTKNIFGGDTVLPPQPVVPLQNGVFNFVPTMPAKSGFTFGSAAQPQSLSVPAANPASGIFNLGVSQPVSTSSGGFNFGSTSTPSFNADMKPSFNFTGGATPTFSAQPPSENPAVAQRRKIRAIRRNPQR